MDQDPQFYSVEITGAEQGLEPTPDTVLEALEAGGMKARVKLLLPLTEEVNALRAQSERLHGIAGQAVKELDGADLSDAEVRDKVADLIEVLKDAQKTGVPA